MPSPTGDEFLLHKPWADCVAPSCNMLTGMALEKSAACACARQGQRDVPPSYLDNAVDLVFYEAILTIHGVTIHS